MLMRTAGRLGFSAPAASIIRLTTGSSKFSSCTEAEAIKISAGSSMQACVYTGQAGMSRLQSQCKALPAQQPQHAQLILQRYVMLTWSKALVQGLGRGPRPHWIRNKVHPCFCWYTRSFEHRYVATVVISPKFTPSKQGKQPVCLDYNAEEVRSQQNLG